MSVTIKDVAKAAGVSPSTVSRVISNHKRISRKTSIKVKAIMQELGYHPNMMAKSLVSRTTNTIGIILPRPAEELFLNFFFAEFIRGISTQAARSGYDLLMTTGTSELEELEAITRIVKGKKVDGVIILYSRPNDLIIDFLHNENFPFVLIGRNEEFPETLCVDNDNIQAAYDATNHLISQGHQRIGFVSGPSNLSVSQDRLEGYKNALRDANLQTRPDWIVEGEFLQESGYRAMSFIMTLPERPTALVGIDDVITFGVLRGLTELGYRVPQDLSLVSFNNLALSELTSPSLSSIDIGIYQLGYTASHTLLSFIANKAMKKSRIVIPHRLVIRESSLHVPQKQHDLY
jgi:DNA-binding LacI/PurR family transcriptional regulator